ncbi:MAG: hypothetical protein CL609_07285 [Anaerolineaceae bacterium]|nr:hypothetical protein [Anaerolineaceae bacterium]
MTKSKYRSGSNANLLKTHNLKAILHSFLYNQHVSRAELAQKTMLSSTTITNLTSEMLDEGIILEENVQDTTEKRQVGRPRTMLSLNPNARVSIGVHIGIGTFRIALTDLYANIKANKNYQFEMDNDPQEVINLIIQAIRLLIEDNHIDQKMIIGIGVGASGLVNHQQGLNVLAPRLGWKNIPIQNILQKELNVPVIVDNNVRTMALGEAMFGNGRDVDVLAFIYGRVGVGAGFVVKGQVYRGSGAGAGEIGHTIVIPKGGAACRCGNYGCLETIISESVIIQEAHLLAEKNPDSLLNIYATDHAHLKPIERVFLAADNGDPYITEMVKDKAGYLGIALSNLVNILNPELIILGGIFGYAGNTFIDETEKKLKSLTFANLGEKVTLQPTQFGWDANIVGASALALSNFFYNPVNE